ncbi:MAG: S8 family serine peptidase [Candidatus Thalassarchaeaceae archaeon]|nr:S8 family serine peptidase [Candidatus Thalassarchaeaceae archaeon]
MRPASIAILVVLVSFPLSSSTVAISDPAEDSPWWESTSMDLDRDGIHDAIWVAIESDLHDWVDMNDTISVIVDFDHQPTYEDQEMLEREVDFRTQFRFHLIDSIAGRVAVDDIVEMSTLPGVVLIELDGILTIQMNDVKDIHGIPMIWEDTGYTGKGSVVSIIDTGIDSEHVGLDDMDDDNSTNDSKVIAFYDAVNNPDKTNGTEVKAYDDQGHGSHCAGITAGTGAPTYEYVGVAPKAQLVGVKVLDEGGSGSFATVMAGMQWTVDKRHDFNIRAASMSLGGFGLIEWTSSEEESVNRMANEMVRSGVALFIAAGNSAVSAQIGTPGSAEDVITVGALDKDTSIAVYSSQGPTEEGRVKPNIAFVGSSVMAPEANSGDGYVGYSGTSMATPGAAGLAALMYQANPDLSPFDIRNIMQETSTYRQCHYMLANEPCAEDLIPKNRQNNVYGHGHVEGLPALLEAANYVYGLNTDLNLSIDEEIPEENRINLSPGESFLVSVEGSPMEIQWRTWDMRDNWMSHPEFSEGDSNIGITHTMLVDRLQYLPGNQIEGNQTVMVRAILDDDASTNLVAHVFVLGSETQNENGPGGQNSSFIVTVLSLVVVLLIGLLTLSVIRLRQKDMDEYELEDEINISEN